MDDKPRLPEDGDITPELREQVAREGEGAHRVLSDPVFTSTLHELKVQFLNQFAQSAAQEKNKREDAYWAIRSLDTIVTTLSERVTRLRVLKEIEESEED